MNIYKNTPSTDFDVMKEFLIYGCELDGKYDIPKLPPINIHPTETVDFAESFSRKIKDYKKLTVNFYITDAQFTRLWNNPQKYIEHLRCFGSICGLDFSIACGDNGMPRAMNIWQHYRSHAFAC